MNSRNSFRIVLTCIVLLVLILIFVFSLVKNNNSNNTDTYSKSCLHQEQNQKNSASPSSSNFNKSTISNNTWHQKRDALIVYPSQATWEFTYTFYDLFSDFNADPVLYSSRMNQNHDNKTTRISDGSSSPHQQLLFFTNGSAKIQSAIKREEEAFLNEKFQHPQCHPYRPKNLENEDEEDEEENEKARIKEESLPNLKRSDFPVRVLVIPTLPQWPLRTIQFLLDIIKPHICVSVSDEADVGFRQLKLLMKEDENVQNDFPYRPRTCSLVLKHYRHHHFVRRSRHRHRHVDGRNKIQRIPLGYRSGMLSQQEAENSELVMKSALPSSKRSLKWSFFGQVYPPDVLGNDQNNNKNEKYKNNRVEMLEVFMKWGPYKTNVDAIRPGEMLPEVLSASLLSSSSSLPISEPEILAKMLSTRRNIMNESLFFSGNFTSVAEVGKIYANSKFVPIGRGFRSLECFRIYEAIVNGAIPVVVSANPKEWRRTFGGLYSTAITTGDDELEDGLPKGWIFAKTWEDALKRVKELDDGGAMLDRLQQQVLNGYSMAMKNIKSRIRGEVDERVDQLRCY